MVRKTSILCILVAFAISTLAQDTSTTDDTAALGSTTPTSSVVPVSDLAATAGDDNTTPLSNSEPVGDPAPPPTSENSSGTSGSDLTTSAGDDDTPSSSESVVNPTPATTTTPAPEDNTVQDADEPDNSSEPQNNGQASSNGTGGSSGTAVSASGYPDQDDGQIITASTPFPQSVLTEMGSRQMRYHHFLWHQVREGWNRFTPDVQQRYIDLGWKPPSPARNYLPNGTVTAIPDNGSGQDFLYMHRDMMNKVKDILARNNETYTITSWKTFPAPGDADWPVPPKYTIPPDNITEDSTNRSKEDSFYSTLQYYEKQFKDPANLRNMTLDELGSQIEVTVHAWLHMRWSANCSVGFRRIYLNKTNLMYIDPIFDGPGNDWLVDTYSSHINPAFYKLHGWIDDRVEDWRIANNLTAIVWNGTWTGGPWETLAPILSAKQSAQLRGSTMNDQMPSMSGNTDVLEEVFKVFAESGVPETSVADDVKPGIPLWEYEP